MRKLRAGGAIICEHLRKRNVAKQTPHSQHVRSTHASDKCWAGCYSPAGGWIDVVFTSLHFTASAAEIQDCYTRIPSCESSILACDALSSSGWKPSGSGGGCPRS